MSNNFDGTYDVVIFGATSFVGQILTRYMFDQFGINSPNLKWAIAGRSVSKLTQVRDDLGPEAGELTIIEADAANDIQLSAMVKQANVIVSTVGPYALYGEPLIKACVESGTDYCDLTGEAHWIAAMLEKYETTAKQNGARIVNCCGFDSLPSDLGVLHLQQNAKELVGQHCEQVKMRVKRIKGGASGGTIASIVNIAKEVSKNPKLRKTLVNPYSLCPEGHGFKARQANVKSAEYDDDFEAWAGPFIMAGINTRVVHRSNALSGNAYGENFLYDEAMLMGRGKKGKSRAKRMGFGLAAFMIGAALKPTRWIMEKFILAKPGEGPSPEEQLNGMFEIDFIGTSQSGDQIHTRVTGDRDPGYGSTAKMLGQAAASLALDFKNEDKPGGFWTPATFFGNKLIERLKKDSGLTFEIVDNAFIQDQKKSA